MPADFNQAFKIISICSAFVPIISGLRNRKTLLWVYPVAALILDIAIQLFKFKLELPHSGLQNLYLLVEFILLSFIYKEAVIQAKKVFYNFFIAALVFFALTTFPHPNTEFNEAGATLFSFCYIILGIAGLYSILKQQRFLYLEKSWFFWLNTGIILYASGNFLIFLFADLRHQDRSMFLSLWQIFWVLNITKNIFLALALYWYRKEDEPNR